MFRLAPGGYAHHNAYWTGRGIKAMAKQCDDGDSESFSARIAALDADYAQLSEVYQRHKGDSDIPLT